MAIIYKEKGSGRVQNNKLNWFLPLQLTFRRELHFKQSDNCSVIEHLKLIVSFSQFSCFHIKSGFSSLQQFAAFKAVIFYPFPLVEKRHSYLGFRGLTLILHSKSKIAAFSRVLSCFKCKNEIVRIWVNFQDRPMLRYTHGKLVETF